MLWEKKLKEIEQRNKNTQKFKKTQSNISSKVLKFEEDLNGFIEDLKNKK